MDNIRTLLIICLPGTISLAMIAAIKSEFPSLLVEVAHTFQAVAHTYEHPVQLILADAAFAPELQSNWPRLAAVHQGATLALIWCDKPHGPLAKGCGGSFDWVYDIVPFNVSLDVFLSGLRLLLMGGSSPAMPNYAARNVESTDMAPDTVESAQSPSTVDVAVAKFERLTKRENQILARMVLGNQNKHIAAALGVSENTVKIHIHNIIAKLGVHNRTEVVALYFDQQRIGRHDHANEPDRTRRWLPTEEP